MKWDIQAMAWLSREFKIGETHPKYPLLKYSGRNEDGWHCFETDEM